MKLLATAEVMRGFDRAAIEGFGIPGALLMENAGRACVDELTKEFGDQAGKHVVVVCGKGNNGGDGFVIARHLANRGARVDTLLLSPVSKLAGDAALNYRILRKMETGTKGHLKIVRLSAKTALRAFEEAELVVDAIFGTGFTGVPKGTAKKMIGWINRRACPVVAVDIPSGVAATTGEVSGDAVRARLTVTMAHLKIGHCVGEGRVRSGQVRVADISLPREAVRVPRDPTFLVEGRDIAALLPERPFNAHKYSVGKVLVIAGSRNFTGAPALTALSALKTGAGAVLLCVPASIHGVLVRKLTDVIIAPCAETQAGTFGTAAFAELAERLSWADVVVLGPGLSRHAETDRLVHRLVAEIPCPLVLDADGLNAMGGKTSILKRRKSPTILTPHTGELSRLVGGESASHDRLRVEAARKYARALKSILVLKGAPTVTAHDGTAIVNSTGNPGMATIGSGDVLGGIIAGLIGQHVPCFKSAYAGVYIHGMAGDSAAEHFGERSILATDILAHIPDALKALA